MLAPGMVGWGRVNRSFGDDPIKLFFLGAKFRRSLRQELAIEVFASQSQLD